MKFILRVIVNAVAIFAAIYLLQGSGINAEGTGWAYFLVLGLIFSLVNAILRPILVTLSCPMLILTLGLGTLLINTLLFFLTGVIGRQFGYGFTVDGFWPAFLGALIVSVVNFVLGIFLKDELSGRRRDRD